MNTGVRLKGSAGSCHFNAIFSPVKGTSSSLGRGWKNPSFRAAFLCLDFSSMVSAGRHHTVLLRSDGCAVACGCNSSGQCDIPPLEEGVRHIQLSAGYEHTVLLRSDGCPVACGCNSCGQCNIPPLDEGLTCTQVSAGGGHTVLLRSDGCPVACGCNSCGQCNIPLLDEGLTYIQVSAGLGHTVLLRSDGCAIACGQDGHWSLGQCNIPPLDEGLTYVQVSAGVHTVLLRSDGCAVACGCNSSGQCDIPHLDEGLTYIQVSAGYRHTVLLRSDGCAVACGCNSSGECDIPPLDEGVTYIQVSAGFRHTVLLRSDGSAVACGCNQDFECNIPWLWSWLDWWSVGLRYVADFNAHKEHFERVFQGQFLQEGDEIIVIFLALDGHEAVRLRTKAFDLALEATRQLALQLKAENAENAEPLRVVLPDGQLLDAVCTADPLVTLAQVCSKHEAWNADVLHCTVSTVSFFCGASTSQS